MINQFAPSKPYRATIAPQLKSQLAYIPDWQVGRVEQSLLNKRINKHVNEFDLLFIDQLLAGLL